MNYVPHESISKARDIVSTGQIMIFVGPEFVVTVRHGDFSGLTGVREEMDADAHHLRLGPFAIMHAIADHVIDDYREVALRMETDIDTIEEQFFSPRTTTEIDQIYLLKREILELRRAVNPLSVALREIVADNKDLICKEVHDRGRGCARIPSRSARGPLKNCQGLPRGLTGGSSLRSGTTAQSVSRWSRRIGGYPVWRPQ